MRYTITAYHPENSIIHCSTVIPHTLLTTASLVNMNSSIPTITRKKNLVECDRDMQTKQEKRIILMMMGVIAMLCTTVPMMFVDISNSKLIACY